MDIHCLQKCFFQSNLIITKELEASLQELKSNLALIWESVTHGHFFNHRKTYHCQGAIGLFLKSEITVKSEWANVIGYYKCQRLLRCNISPFGLFCILPVFLFCNEIGLLNWQLVETGKQEDDDISIFLSTWYSFSVPWTKNNDTERSASN